MPPSTRRSPRTAPVRRSPKAAPVAPEVHDRPLLVPFAAVFGLLVAAEALYLATLVWEPRDGVTWYLVVPGLLSLLAVAGAVLTFLGRARGWLVLAIAAVLDLLVLLAVGLLFLAFGGLPALLWVLLLLVAPVGCLALCLRRPVREWSRPGRATRPPRGRRSGGAAR